MPESINDQIAKYVQAHPGIKVYQMANIQVRTQDSITTVLNLALNTMNGRNKLLKFVKSIKQLRVIGDDLQASVFTEQVPLTDSMNATVCAVEKSWLENVNNTVYDNAITL
ncbi:hypothetical protein HK103_005293 [Boothiomyces macroporosus]|uniref:Uncharacterized protein n=1 Tax=Boothiomyces macroporosus TaxID=261099 RepID=A0AAD5UFS8_9FUNG|nr:hypothetical protein HK103_005293 [Boothiomyces macroporosus]